LQLNASLVRAAGSNLISPEIEAALVRLAIEKIQVVGADKEARRIYGVGSIREIVVRDGYGRARWCAQGGAKRIAEINRKSLRAFQIRVIDDEYRDRFGRLARCKSQGRKPSFVIAARRSDSVNRIAILQAGKITGGKADVRRSVTVGRARDSHVDALIAFANVV